MPVPGFSGGERAAAGGRRADGGAAAGGLCPPRTPPRRRPGGGGRAAAAGPGWGSAPPDPPAAAAGLRNVGWRNTNSRARTLVSREENECQGWSNYSSISTAEQKLNFLKNIILNRSNKNNILNRSKKTYTKPIEKSTQYS